MKRFYGNFNPTITVYEVIQTLDDEIERIVKRLDKIENTLYENDYEHFLAPDEYDDLMKRSDRLHDRLHKKYEVCEALVRAVNKIEVME